MRMKTDLREMLIQDNLGVSSPIYDVDGADYYVIGASGFPQKVMGNGPVNVPLHPMGELSVEDSIASCILAACKDQEFLLAEHLRQRPQEMRHIVWDEFAKRDVPPGSILVSALTAVTMGELMPGSIFVHRSVPHGMAVLCGEPQYVGAYCYDDVRLKFGVFVNGNNVFPVIVLGSTDVDMARSRYMDVVEVMEA
jgi:hypothetical protein